MIRVFIADDHPLIREGLRRLLAAEPDLAVAGEVASGTELLEGLARVEADVLVMDMNMPGRPGMETLADVRARRPDLTVLILTMHPEDYLAVRTLRAGAAGYITKDSAPEELLRAIRKVAGGGRYISPGVAERLADAMDLTIDRPPHEGLSDREYEVLILIARGRTSAEIAETLAVSPATVSTYRSRVMEKMGMSTVTELMHYAISRGLTDASGGP